MGAEMIARLDAIACEKISCCHWPLAFGLQFENLYMPLASRHPKLLTVSRNHDARQRVSGSARGA